MLINRVIRISSYIGQELKELKNFHTRKILIEFMLAENDKTYHVYGKLTTKQKIRCISYLKLKYMMTHILNLLMLMLILVNIMISYLKTIKIIPTPRRWY
jgi:hypothetical protein